MGAVPTAPLARIMTQVCAIPNADLVTAELALSAGNLAADLVVMMARSARSLRPTVAEPVPYHHVIVIKIKTELYVIPNADLDTTESDQCAGKAAADLDATTVPFALNLVHTGEAQDDPRALAALAALAVRVAHGAAAQAVRAALAARRAQRLDAVLTRM